MAFIYLLTFDCDYCIKFGFDRMECNFSDMVLTLEDLENTQLHCLWSCDGLRLGKVRNLGCGVEESL